MSIRYPNGKLYTPASSSPTKSSTKAPTQKLTSSPTSGKKASGTKRVQSTFSNRGKSLEDDLNDTNSYYLVSGIANIHKKPVPIQIVKVEYPSRSAAVIREGYFRTPSTTDYNGVWQGKYIDFEAKETENKTSFPLSNIHKHQITHMQSVVTQKGVAFFIIRFSALNRYFVVPFNVIDDAWATMENGGRKSIPLKTIEDGGFEVQLSYTPRLDYLKALQQWLNE